MRPLSSWLESSSAASAERLLEAPAEGRLERDGEQLGRAGRSTRRRRRDADEVVAECLNVPIDSA